MRFKRKYALFTALMLLAALLLASCSKAEDTPLNVDFNNSSRTIGLSMGSAADVEIRNAFPKANINHYKTMPDAYTALKQGKIDAVAYDGTLLEYEIARGLDGVQILKEDIGEGVDVAIGISRRAAVENLKEKIDAALTELRENGVLDDMFSRWVMKADTVMPEIELPSGGAVLRVATTGVVPPFTYYEKGTTLTGYDIELARRVAKYLGMDVEFSLYSFDAISAAAEAGSVDCIMTNFNATAARREILDFSTPMYVSRTALLVRSESDIAYGAAQVLENLKASFTRTFITEERWRLILGGLGITLAISILSLLFGTLLGFGICMLRRSRVRFLARFAAVFIRVIQGTPIIVLLMILYYVIFNSTNISSVFIAVIGFSINFGVYVSEMMRTGIEAVEKGQIEAAYALGFPKARAFFRITFPQAALHFLPVFKGEFISMVKMTSVVGYIAIADLTQVSDIIRSLTMEAFFPLFVTALIYFLVANALTALLSRIEIKIDPKRRKNILKGMA